VPGDGAPVGVKERKESRRCGALRGFWRVFIKNSTTEVSENLHGACRRFFLHATGPGDTSFYHALASAMRKNSFQTTDFVVVPSLVSPAYNAPEG
jgi:hypothetical protein